MRKGYTITPAGLIITNATLEYVTCTWEKGEVTKIILLTEDSVIVVPMKEVCEAVNPERRP